MRALVSVIDSVNAMGLLSHRSLRQGRIEGLDVADVVAGEMR